MLSAFISAVSFGCKSEVSENASFEESIGSTIESTEPEESKTPMEEIYDFLNSEYRVISRRESFDTVYVTEYYFVDGTVGGAKLITTFPTENAASDYFDTISEDYENAELVGTTVTNYIADDKDFYYGYTLEKLKYMLEKANYEVTVDFDEKVFLDEYSEVSAD